MQLTMRQAASYLGVSEGTAERWIGHRGLPAHRAHERWYVNPMELWEWAVEQGLPVSRALLSDASKSRADIPALSELLARGGVFHDVPGESKPAVLRAIVERLPLPPEHDRRFLLDVLEAREALGSTGIGDGIAIPHVRNPIVLQLDDPFVSLCLLAHPVEFGALDGLPVHALFIVVSPAVTAHLGLLARLAFVLRDDGVRALLRRRAPAEEIIARIEAVESTRHTGEFAATKPTPE